MDNFKVYTKKNKLKSYIKFNSLSGSKANLFKYNKLSSPQHEFKKFCIFVELINKGLTVYVEPEFKNSLGRPDILAINETTGEGTIYEISCSESQKSIKEKNCKYPIEFELIFIKPLDKIEILI